MARAPLIHIGYHKTGTTWLQARLFPRADLGWALPFPDRKQLTRQLVTVDDLTFDPAAAFDDHFRDGLARASDAGLVPVVSNERFSGFPLSGGSDSRAVADRLRATFGEARVLVAVREQVSMILSNYLQYLRDGGTARLDRFLAPPPALGSRRPVFRAEFYRYVELIRYYAGLFGRRNVLVLPYEQFATEPERFVRRLFEHCGLDPQEVARGGLPFGARDNPAGDASFLRGKRVASVLFGTRLNDAPLVAAPRLERLALGAARVAAAARPGRTVETWERRIRTAVGDTYRASNAELADWAGLDLARWGWALP